MHRSVPPRAPRGSTAPLLILIGAFAIASAGAAEDRGGGALVAISGTVRDAWHSAIEGSVIEAFDSSDRRVARTRSGPRGEFVLPQLPAGLYRLLVKAPGFETATIAVDLGPATPPVDLVLKVSSGNVVTIQGSPVSQQAQTGTSAMTITRESLQALPGGDAQSLSDIIATQPGTVRDVFGIGPIHIRANQAGILYVLDGVPLPEGILGQFADVVPTRLVQSVRLLTGGLPAEYGDQIGGVIDVTTRRGSDKPEGEVQVAYGTYQTIQPSAFYSQSFGKVDVFLEGTYLGTQLGLNPPDVSPILHDGEVAGSVFGRIDYHATAQDRLELLADFSQHNYQIPIDPTILPLSEGPPGAIRGVDAYGNAPPIFVPYNANPTQLEQDLFAILSYTHTSDGRSLQVAPYVRSSSSDLNCDPIRTLGATADPGSICSDVNRQLLHEGATATYAWNTWGNHSWKTGLLIDDAQSATSYTQFTRLDSSPNGGPNPDKTISGTDDINVLLGGLFLQDEITVGKAKILPGVRVDVQNATYGGGGIPNLLLAGPSARLGFSYLLTEALQLHGYAGYLWSPPSTLDAPEAARILVPNLGTIPAADNLKAERDEFVELGLAYRIFRRLSASLTAWGRYSQDQVDIQPVGATNLVANYNYNQGRAVGVELAADAVVNKYLKGFGNVTWEVGQGQGVDSAEYLFTKQELAYTGWEILDHVQSWTVNVGGDLHDEAATSHFSVLLQYGSGLRTGSDNDEVVPGHFTINATLRHRFDFAPFHAELAMDVLNLLDAVYPLRIANGWFDGAYGPLRQIDVRLIIPLGG